jgi:glyoxylase-like metal-dependent hydrolase (beta-lactamase superfamily II)
MQGYVASHSPDLAIDVARIPLMLVNAYLFGARRATDRSWVLIDAGTWFSGRKIRRHARNRFGDTKPAAIILTHGHFDHVGSLSALAEEWNVPIFAHPLEFPFLNGTSSYPPPDPSVGGGLMSRLSWLYPRGPIDVLPRLQPLPDDQSVPFMPGWKWIHTPGHTPGHVALFRSTDRFLIAGDAFVTQKQESMLGVLTQAMVVSRPPAYYTTDWEAARRSVATLAALEPKIAATGHGIPMQGIALRDQLRDLVDHWNQFKPSHGRYVSPPYSKEQ